MQPEQKKCSYKFSVEETEEGYDIHLKGDKEKLKAKLDAIEAYRNFREKAEAAGLHSHRSHNCGYGLLSLIHKHIQIVHRHNCKSSETETVE